MIVYHGSLEQIEKPDIFHSKRYLDFGKGFYLTTIREQAEKWAIRKAIRKNNTEKAIVNIYDLQDNLNEYKVRDFNGEDEAWLDFVCACRNGEEIYLEYDIIIGNVADDDVFKTVDMYFRGIWDKERTIKELRYYKKNNQIVIVTQEVLENVLKFQSAYQVEVFNGR